MTSKLTDLPKDIQGSIVVTGTAFALACHSLAQLSENTAEQWQELIEIAAIDAVRKFSPRQITAHLEDFEKQVNERDSDPIELIEADLPGSTLEKPDNWEEIKAQFEKERGTHLSAEIDLEFCLALIGHLQLALRHPANRGPTSELVRKFTHDLIEKLCAKIPACREVCMKGFDARYDQ